MAQSGCKKAAKKVILFWGDFLPYHKNNFN